MMKPVNNGEPLVSVDAKAANNIVNVVEETPHIVLKPYEGLSGAELEKYEEEFRKLVIACPAAAYRVDDNGNMNFEVAACLECGTCRVLCGETIIDTWRMPVPTAEGAGGINYLFG
ncbi:MAG: 4Fe-4S dicluster domain-containing protein [Eggerthellales bacterium]|nr:4Fe-4S dicluster domain-containing protein [Eggerthellales bacterium]